MKLCSSAAALGLYRYDAEQPNRDLFSRFYSSILKQLQTWSVAPTYIAAEGDAYSGELVKVGSNSHDRLLKSNFADVSVLSVVANPPGSDEPSYDSFVNASLSYVEVSRELLVCVVANESFVKLRSAEYDRLFRAQVELCQWDFGYGFSSDVQKQPEFHILGLDNGKLSPEEYKSLCTWYSAPPEIRTAVLRDVYPYNLLNRKQLDATVTDDVTLRKFVQLQHGCKLTRLTDYDIYLWEVPDNDIARLRELLQDSPAMLGVDPNHP